MKSFYKNKKTRYHPSLELSNDGKIWENLELTSSPTKNGKYIKLKNNPNPNSTKTSYIRKYVRKDPIRTRGELLKKYKLSNSDLKEIEKFLKEKNKK